MSPPPTASVFSLGLLADQVARIASGIGLPVGVGQEPASGDFVFAWKPTYELIVKLLGRNRAHVIELIPGHDPDPALLRTEQADIFLSLITTTAWSLNLSAVLCDTLEDRSFLPASARPRVELALHEILGNAMVHGNLELPGSFVSDPVSFDLLCQRIKAAMSDTTLSMRRIKTSVFKTAAGIKVRVADEGPGFYAGTVTADPGTDISSGHGIAIVRSLASSYSVEEGGRLSVVSFEW